jgi:hypothetical protein
MAKVVFTKNYEKLKKMLERNIVFGTVSRKLNFKGKESTKKQETLEYKMGSTKPNNQSFILNFENKGDISDITFPEIQKLNNNYLNTRKNIFLKR